MLVRIRGVLDGIGPTRTVLAAGLVAGLGLGLTTSGAAAQIPAAPASAGHSRGQLL
jgi:hypothetical protein